MRITEPEGDNEVLWKICGHLGSIAFNLDRIANSLETIDGCVGESDLKEDCFIVSGPSHM